MVISVIVTGLVVMFAVYNSLSKTEKDRIIVYDYRDNPEVLDEIFKN